MATDTLIPMPAQLALFDLDHTLLPIDSDYEWGRFMISLGLVDETHHKTQNDLFYQQYQQGTLKIEDYLAFQIAPMTHYDMAQLQVWREQFISQVISPNIKTQAKALVQAHLERGDLCLIITGTNEFVTSPIAPLFGVEHLLAVQLEQQGGRYTGKLSGIASFREGKITRLNQFLAQRNQTLSDFSQSYFYSDSANDLPLMKLVDHPVATNPDPTLRAHAQTHGWKTLDLFA
jgi:HAD superfamily hydrolase (TIGR01490 family)